MSTKQPNNACDSLGHELVRLMCADAAEPAPELRAHLAECAACRELLASSRDLVGALRVALKPEPLPSRLATRIKAELDERTSPGRSTWLVRLSLVGTAAAACLLAALLGPSATIPPTAPMVMELSSADAVAIVDAYAALQWEGTVAYSVEALSERIEDVSQTLTPGAEARSGLPWGPEDDWDVPVGEDETRDTQLVPEYAQAAWPGTADQSLDEV